MAKLREILVEGEYISEDLRKILNEQLSAEELNKSLSSGAATQVAQIVSKLDSLESQDTILFHKINQLESQREKIETKKTELLNSLHYQLKPVKVDEEGKQKAKKVSSLNFPDFFKPLKLEKD